MKLIRAISKRERERERRREIEKGKEKGSEWKPVRFSRRFYYSITSGEP